MDKEFELLKEKILDLIEKGHFLVKKNEIIFLLDLKNDTYIYKVGNKYRVMVPHPFKDDKKYHVGYFDSFAKAVRIRDAVLRALNKKALKRLFNEKS